MEVEEWTNLFSKHDRGYTNTKTHHKHDRGYTNTKINKETYHLLEIQIEIGALYFIWRL